MQWVRCLSALVIVLLAVSSAEAARIEVGDFDAEATLIGFDALAHNTFLDTEFSALGVIFESGPPSGPESGSTNPNDFLQPGESVSPFVAAITAVPASSTPSPPMKVIATKIGAGGGILQYDAGSIVVTFLDPIPTMVGLHITDADLNNNASFFGPGGLLDTHVLGPGTGGPAFVGFEDLDGISQIVVKSSIPGGGGSGGVGIDDVRFGNPVPEPSTALLLGVGLAAMARRRYRTPLILVGGRVGSRRESPTSSSRIEEHASGTRLVSAQTAECQGTPPDFRGYRTSALVPGRAAP